jgi:hypothetical protein
MMRRHPPTRIGSRTLPAATWGVCDMCDRPQRVWTAEWLCERCMRIRSDILRDQPERAA